MKYHTTRSDNSESSQVRIGLFDPNRHGFKQLAPYWLRKMAADGFQCTQRHTLSLSGGAAEILILVCEEVANPTTPVAEIFFDHMEISGEYGHAITADCGSPASIEVLHDFWRCGGGNGEATPHFEDLVLPLVHKLVSNFEEEST